jgi:hypothetical protein
MLARVSACLSCRSDIHYRYLPDIRYPAFSVLKRHKRGSRMLGPGQRIIVAVSGQVLDRMRSKLAWCRGKCWRLPMTSVMSPCLGQTR